MLLQVPETTEENYRDNRKTGLTSNRIYDLRITVQLFMSIH
jgi:hypothetical protein